MSEEPLKKKHLKDCIYLCRTNNKRSGHTYHIAASRQSELLICSFFLLFKATFSSISNVISFHSRSETLQRSNEVLLAKMVNSKYRQF